MKTLLPLIILLVLTNISFAQKSIVWPIKKLDTARNINYLSKNEKDVILEINKVRYNPAEYANEFMKWIETFYNKKYLVIPGKNRIKTNEGKEALIQCIKALQEIAPVPPLVPSKGMSKACELLMYDQSFTGKTGHKGSGNNTPSKRLNRFGEFSGYFAENLHYGDCEPRFIVISLLIDDGIHSKGDRKNMLKTEFKKIGIAIGKHKTQNNMCVMNFCSSYTSH